MYLLLNQEGKITSCITHGQLVRQGNSFDLYICFPHESQYQNLDPFSKFSVNGEFIVAGEKDFDMWGVAITFKSLDPNEAVLGFKNGAKYYCYHIYVPKTSGVTSQHGEVPMLIFTIPCADIDCQGRATLNVLKTYGNDEDYGIEQENFDTLMKAMKKATSLYTFEGAPYTNKASVSELYMYAWKTVGFIRGFITLLDKAENLLPASSLGIPVLSEEDDYAVVGTFSACADVSVPATVFGHSESGEDVEFKIVGDGTVDDEEQTAYLLINRNSDAPLNDPIAIVGNMMVAEYKRDYTITDDDDETTDGKNIVQISATSQSYGNVPDGTSLPVQVEIEKIQGTENDYSLNFALSVPKGADGSDGEDGQDAGFGSITASGSATTLIPGQSASVSASVSESGTAQSKNLAFSFNFGIPSGADGAITDVGGAIGFQVNSSGQLILTSSDGGAHGLSLNSSGQLIYTY